jgi:hypothetical protein
MWDLTVRLRDFAEAVVGYWYFWVTGVLFVIDQSLSNKYLPLRFIELLDRMWPPENRHHVFRWACVAGFVVASFQAFDHADRQRQHAETALQTTATNLSNKEIEVQSAQRALEDARRQLAEATVRVPPKPAFDIAGNDTIFAKSLSGNIKRDCRVFGA